ncbi:neutral amino acid permease [Fusarium heterosporum]|uniref:Neutral amino acid permease n=1 Tax=Fusarium heterosporum TaxID=42747 RepID=A0A8H5X3M7_FUSHE|nr:neutral amino acid permease [Fusarium heterosporum]
MEMENVQIKEQRAPYLVSEPSRASEVQVVGTAAVAHDAVFGNITEDGPNYRSVGWLGTSALMMKTQIGLGILSIPSAFHTLGIIPGIICLITIAVITTWSDYVVGTFKLNHREVYGIDDAGGILFGRIGREVLGIGFALFTIFTSASGILGISISFNALSTHGTCTATFVAIAALIVFLCSSIRTLGRMSWLAWVGVISLMAAVYLVTIAVGIQDRPSAAPKIELDHDWKSDYKLYNRPGFADAMTAISTIIFAYAGTPLFFPIAAEMRDPRHYTKAMMLCQSVATFTYIVVGIVIYYYCGSYVASPALGSAGKTIKQVAYGLTLPGLIAGATINAHVTGKYAFVRILRGSRHLTANTFVHWAAWLGLTFTTSLVAYIIASAIPVFGSLVSLVGALLGTLQTFQPYGCFWLYDNWAMGIHERSLNWILMVTWSIFVIVSGTFLMIAGTYGSVLGIIDSNKTSGGSSAWSCADNSNSV